ncbi:MAG: hypothetical protein LBB63_03755 [Holosporaceae bacterium]|nr:hypothetical protein [Holosporaceae bacterium]
MRVFIGRLAEFFKIKRIIEAIKNVEIVTTDDDTLDIIVQIHNDDFLNDNISGLNGIPNGGILNLSYRRVYYGDYLDYKVTELDTENRRVPVPPQAQLDHIKITISLSNNLPQNYTDIEDNSKTTLMNSFLISPNPVTEARIVNQEPRYYQQIFPPPASVIVSTVVPYFNRS